MSGRGTKGVPKAERMAAILAAASAMFVEQGYANTSVAAIAAQAGVTKPLVYSYFTSKGALYGECVRAAGERILGDVVSAQRGTYADRAVGTITAILRAIEQSPADWALIMFDTSVHPGMEEFELVDHYRRAVSGVGVESVAELVAASDAPHEDGDERLLAQFWLAIVTTSVTWSMRHPAESADQTADRVRRILVLLASMLGGGVDDDSGGPNLSI